MSKSYMRRLSADARFWMRGPRGFVIAVFLVLQLAIVFTGANRIGILLENKTGRAIHSIKVLYNTTNVGGAVHTHIGHLAVNESEFVMISPSEAKEYGSFLLLEIQPEESGVIEHRNTRVILGRHERGWVRITLGAGFSVKSFEATAVQLLPFSAF